MCSDNEIELSHKMNHCVVPDFQMNDDYTNIPSAISTTSKKSKIADEGIMELIWQNGQVIVQSQSQNQRCMKKSHLFSDESAVEETVAASAPLFMQEDEMSSWLRSPLDDDDDDYSFAADFLCTPPCSAAAARPEEVDKIDTTPSCAAVTSAAALQGDIDKIDTTLSCSAVISAALPGEIDKTDTTPSCAAVTSAAALQGDIDKIGTLTAEIRPPAPQLAVAAIASSSPRLILPQLRCTEGELPHRLQNFRYTTPNCTAVASAAAPPGEIHASTQPIIPQLTCNKGESTHRSQNFQYTMPNCSAVSSAASPLVETIASSSTQPILPQLRRTEGESLQNFRHFSRNCSSNSGHSVKASTAVESNATLIASVPEHMFSRVSDNVTSVSTAAIGGVREVMTSCELTLTSSTSGSGGSISAAVAEPPPWKEAHAAEDRKRRSRESDDDGSRSEDADAKKQVRSSTSAKKSRAAEVHNLSERKRRDRINEKMRALQELIPHCNKSDKASMLDEAIEYLKSLQVQVQMMSTGCSMVPMMYPGIPQYMPTMGMNMSMEMGMNRPMVPYPPLMPGPAMQNATAAVQMAPRYPLTPYHLPPFPAPDPSRMPVANQPDPPRLNSLVEHNTNQSRLPNFSDPYQQYFGLQQAQLMLPQNQEVEELRSSKLNSCIEGSEGNHQSG